METHKTPIITINNAKGGVGKSTSAYTLAYVLSTMKKEDGSDMRILLCDLDPQSNATSIAGVDSYTLECSMAHVLTSYAQKERVKIEDCILQLTDTLYLAPSQLELSTLDSVANNLWSREYLLKKSLESVVDLFDCIIIDCQPSLSLLPINALACATHVIVPCNTDYLSYKGLGLILNTIEMVKENLNNDLQFYGILCTRHEGTNHSKEILTLFEDTYPVIGTIPKGVVVSDAMYSSTGSVTEFAPKSKPALAYKAVAKKIYDDLGLGKVKEGK